MKAIALMAHLLAAFTHNLDPQTRMNEKASARLAFWNWCRLEESNPRPSHYE